MVPVTKVTCKGLLFDMDGVLISSIASVNRCWRLWAAHFDVANPEQVEVAHGTRAFELMLTYKPEWRDAPDREEKLREGLRYIEDLEIDDVADLKVLPGVRALLASLPPERWTIVTSATRRLLLGRLAAAKLPYPAEFIAADDVKNGKPHPEPYMTGAKLLGFSPADCVVVEDATTGVGSGVEAGSRVLGVTGTYPAGDLYRAGATWVVASLETLRVATGQDGLDLEFEQIAV
jgi:sugar-phosphatase